MSDDVPHQPHPVLGEADVVGLIAMYVARLPSTPCKDIALYRTALTHPSCCKPGAHARQSKEELALASYERLEYLGDAVLYMACAQYLHERYPTQDEGFLTKMRTQLVNGTILARLCAQGTCLPRFVMRFAAASSTLVPSSGQGGRGQGGRSGSARSARTPKVRADTHAPSVLEDVLEAFVGALVVEHGYDLAREWLVGLYEAHVDFAELVMHRNQAKDLLAQHMVRLALGAPRYVDASPASLGNAYAPDATKATHGNAEVVHVRVLDGAGVTVAVGSGPTRRAAEDDGARRALLQYGKLTRAAGR